MIMKRQTRPLKATGKRSGFQVLRWWVAGVCCCVCSILHADVEVAREARLVMGSIAVVDVAGLVRPMPALDAAYAALEDVDTRMSLWHESELTRLNAAGEAVLSAPLWTVVDAALTMAMQSGGAFDPSVAPWVPGGPGVSVPPGRAQIGYTGIRRDAARRWVSLNGRYLDLGGIAKGYACDRAAAAVMQAGASGVVVNLGQSSIKVFGDQRTEVIIRDPENPAAAPWGQWRLRDAALSSSGGDQRPDHIIDPRTRLPAKTVVAATVVSTSAMEADAWSTAVYVLGAESGLRMLAARGLDGFVLLHDQGQKQILTTLQFARKYRLQTPANVQTRELAPEKPDNDRAGERI